MDPHKTTRRSKIGDGMLQEHMAACPRSTLMLLLARITFRVGILESYFEERFERRGWSVGLTAGKFWEHVRVYLPSQLPKLFFVQHACIIVLIAMQHGRYSAAFFLPCRCVDVALHIPFNCTTVSPNKCRRPLPPLPCPRSHPAELNVHRNTDPRGRTVP